MTSDGISKADWEKVPRLACRVTNATLKDDPVTHRLWHGRLMDCLDRLEVKYGVLPSIVATRGDFSGDKRQKVSWWKKAHALAEARRDDVNLYLTASSLAEFMIEEAQDARQGRKWLEVMETYLPLDDDWEIKLCWDLRRKLVKLKRS